MMITKVYVKREGKHVLLGQCAPLAVGSDSKVFRFREPFRQSLYAESPQQVAQNLQHYDGRLEWLAEGGQDIPILVIGTEDDPHWIPGFIWKKDLRHGDYGDV